MRGQGGVGLPQQHTVAEQGVLLLTRPLATQAFAASHPSAAGHACLLPPCWGLQSLGQPMKYEGSWVEQWNQRGISVCGLDLQACAPNQPASRQPSALAREVAISTCLCLPLLLLGL